MQFEQLPAVLPTLHLRRVRKQYERPLQMIHWYAFLMNGETRFLQETLEAAQAKFLSNPNAHLERE